jgi:RND family efflux transporter MFP subunit
MGGILMICAYLLRIFLPVGFCFLACSKPVPPIVQVAPIPVRTAVVSMQSLQKIVYTSGLTNSSKEMNLSFKLGGLIEGIWAQEGASVHKGDTLAILDRTDIQARLVQARVAQQKAHRDFETIQALFADSAATRDQVLDAQTALYHTQAMLDIAVHSLDQMALVAPADGRIIRKLGEVREVLGPGMPLFLFDANNHHLVLRTGVTDRDVLFVAVGDSARVQFDAHRGVSVPAVVNEIAPSADPRTGLYKVELTLLPGSITLLPGMIGYAHIRTEHKRQLPAVPVKALIEADADRGFVYVLHDSVVHRRAVVLDVWDQDKVLVKEGVMAGEQVITEGASYLRDHSRVVVQTGQGL